MAMMARFVRQQDTTHLLRRALAGRAAGFSSASPEGPSPLTGQVAWVVGGAGVIGRGICRGLLKAGATVIVSSNSNDRLEMLSTDLGSPENLITIHGTMRASGAKDTVKQAMEKTNDSLNHVVAHSGVKWWSASQSAGTGRDCEELGAGGSGKGLNLDAITFIEQASLLPALHYTAAQLLLPRLKETPGSSYTFVTGGAGQESSIEAQVNAHGVWGVAAALREQFAGSPVRVSEVRVTLKIGRSAQERALDPRTRPLSADLGELCAGLAASQCPSIAAGEALHHIDSMEDVGRLWARYPCPAVMDDLPILCDGQKVA